MTEPLPIVLVPGLLTSPRLFAEQLPALWRHGPVTIASTTAACASTTCRGRTLTAHSSLAALVLQPRGRGRAGTLGHPRWPARGLAAGRRER